MKKEKTNMRTLKISSQAFWQIITIIFYCFTLSNSSNASLNSALRSSSIDSAISFHFGTYQLAQVGGNKLLKYFSRVCCSFTLSTLLLLNFIILFLLKQRQARRSNDFFLTKSILLLLLRQAFNNVYMCSE